MFTPTVESQPVVISFDAVLSWSRVGNGAGDVGQRSAGPRDGVGRDEVLVADGVAVVQPDVRPWSL
jgi:hypothetical protein